MSDDVGTATGRGWKVHGGILLAGLALAVPIAIVDLTLLGPSGGGWISLDFRGWLIGAYGALWLTESLLSTGLVAVFRGRSALVVLLAHVAAVAILVLAGVTCFAVWEISDERALEDNERDRQAMWERAPNDLTIVSWHRVPDAATATIVVTIRANESGELGAEYARRPDAYVSPYAEHAMSPGQEVTLTLEVDPYNYDDGGDPGDGDYVFVAWSTDAWNVPLCFCRPACEPDSIASDLIRLELPEPER